MGRAKCTEGVGWNVNERNLSMLCDSAVALVMLTLAIKCRRTVLAADDGREVGRQLSLAPRPVFSHQSPSTRQ